MSCTVAVQLIPGGAVMTARITRSSGDPIFDSSVEKAVLKASPLKLPPDASLFDRFRDLEFVFSPEG
jgi:colicin import membrane protein